MWGIIVFVVVAMLLPLAPVLFARMGAGMDELEASFQLESVVIDGAQVSAGELKVLHRSCGTASYSRAGSHADRRSLALPGARRGFPAGAGAGPAVRA